MALTKLQQQVQDLANKIDEDYVSIVEVDKENNSDCESDCSETTLEDDYESEEENVLEPIQEEPDTVIETPPPSPVKVKRKYTKRQPKVGIATSDPNIQVIMKSKKKGPNKVKQVVVYREDVPQQEIQIVEKTRRPRGRPKNKQLVNVIKEPEEPDVIAFERPTKVKMTAKELKTMELEVRLLELQSVSGNSSLKLNKKGKVDGRQSKQRTQKQLDATARLVEANKLKRMKKASDLKEELMSEQTAIGGIIISSLNTATVVEKENQNKLAVVEKEQADKKAKDRRKALSLFD
jgi:hypothetical protein